MAKTGTQEYPHGFGHFLPPVHPGSVLAGELKKRGLSSDELALALRVPTDRITDIVRGRRGLSAETALRLGRYFGTGAQIWANLQVQCDLATAARELDQMFA
jgi:addiction module HigA family antidote